MSRTDPTTAEVVASVSAPLPTDRRSLSRRHFLQAMTAATGVAVLPGWLADAAEAATPVGPGDGVLVLITMTGGNDGLNTIIPVDDGAYFDRRGPLAIGASAALAISETRALHPNLGELERLWRQGDVAVVDGVGAPGTDLSHFSSMARWMAGSAGTGGHHSGWLGRYIDDLPGGDDPFHGVSIGSSIPLLMQGRHRQASGLPDEANGIFQVAGVDPTYRRQYDALVALGDAATGRGELADALADSGRRAVDLAATIEPIYGEDPPDGGLSRKLDLCARLINANVGIRVLSVMYGDFDSHADQPEMHDARMAELDEGIRAFYARLHSTFGARTLLLAVSEFGRRVKANRSNGTDHGAAGSLLAIGTQVRGGFYGDLPSLTALDRQGNLIPTVDYRSVYATVLDGWLRADSSQILGGTYEDLGFVAPPAPSRTTSGRNPTIAGSTMLLRAQIIRLYKAFFGRLPESQGLDHWVQARRTGMSLVQVAEALAGSAEFINRYGHLTNRQFVELLYANVLGRAADAGGLDHWTSVLDGGATRGRVMVGFSESNEFVAATTSDVDRVDTGGPVARLYLAYFLRAAETEGLHYWLTSGLSYRAISDAFAASSEFQQRYGNLSDADFVDLVYQNVLGRPADAGGRQYWIDEMARGVTRGQVMLSFSESAEFVTRTGTLP
ncbi:MAG: DUF4214 domain-containing protein [Acidimicrobiia bacterium]|nr:DUF4214 domain-containing protein [Acidimicrobiia bacterium]